MTGLVPPIWPATCYVRPVELMPSGQRALTHRAILKPPGTSTASRGYVKHFLPSSTRGLLNEIVGWSLNRLVGVPQGNAAVMVDAPRFGVAASAPAFVSLEASPKADGTAVERYDITNPQQMLALIGRLKQCRQLPFLVAADQLAFNADRNLGNFGFNGKHTFVVFDQSDILGGCDWSTESLCKPTPWSDHQLIGDSDASRTLMPFASLEDGLRRELMGALNQVLARFYKGQAKLREALLVSHNRDTLLAMDAVFWRTLWIETSFRQRLGLVL